MAYENNDKRQESVYSSRVKAGKRRTYFFDVRATRANDYFLTITESRKRFDDDGYDRSKLFLYKEDFNKFIKGLTEAVDFVKTDLMPDFNFDAFNHEEGEQHTNGNYVVNGTTDTAPAPLLEDVIPETPVAEILAADEPYFIEEPVLEAQETSDAEPVTTSKHVQIEEVDKW